MTTGAGDDPAHLVDWTEGMEAALSSNDAEELAKAMGGLVWCPRPHIFVEKGDREVNALDAACGLLGSSAFVSSKVARVMLTDLEMDWRNIDEVSRRVMRSPLAAAFCAAADEGVSFVISSIFGEQDEPGESYPFLSHLSQSCPNRIKFVIHGLEHLSDRVKGGELGERIALETSRLVKTFGSSRSL